MLQLQNTLYCTYLEYFWKVSLTMQDNSYLGYTFVYLLLFKFGDSIALLAFNTYKIEGATLTWLQMQIFSSLPKPGDVN